jgi:putative transposase
VQLTTVGKAIWRGARKAQELEAAGAGDPQVQERLEKLKQVETLRRRGVPWREVQEVVGISRATYYRWRKRLKEEGLSGLRPRSRRPKRTRGKVRWSPDTLFCCILRP